MFICISVPMIQALHACITQHKSVLYIAEQLTHFTAYGTKVCCGHKVTLYSMDIKVALVTFSDKLCMTKYVIKGR